MYLSLSSSERTAYHQGVCLSKLLGVNTNPHINGYFYTNALFRASYSEIMEACIKGSSKWT